MLHLTAPSLPSVLPTRPHLRPPTPRLLLPCPLLPPSRHLPAAPQLLSNTTEAHRLLLNSHSTLLSPLPLNSSSPLLLYRRLHRSKLYLHPPTRVPRLHRVRLPLPRPPSRSSPSLHPSLLSPRRLHLPASLPSPPAHPPLPRAPSHLEHPRLPLSLGLFLLLVLLPPLPLLVSTQAHCRHSSSPLHPSRSPITQGPLLPELRCLPLLWLRATTCLQDLRAHQALLGPCSSLHHSLACRQDTLLSRTVRLGRLEALSLAMQALIPGNQTMEPLHQHQLQLHLHRKDLTQMPFLARSR